MFVVSAVTGEGWALAFLDTIGAESLSRAKAVLERRILEASPNYRWCLSPSCSAGQLHVSDPSLSTVICGTCSSKSCFLHKIPWHKGYSCEEYDRSHPAAAVARTSEEMIKSEMKKCPGPNCLFYVEKDGGCDNLFCKSIVGEWEGVGRGWDADGG